MEIHINMIPGKKEKQKFLVHRVQKTMDNFFSFYNSQISFTCVALSQIVSASLNNDSSLAKLSI